MSPVLQTVGIVLGTLVVLRLVYVQWSNLLDRWITRSLRRVAAGGEPAKLGFRVTVGLVLAERQWLVEATPAGIPGAKLYTLSAAGKLRLRAQAKLDERDGKAAVR